MKTKIAVVRHGLLYHRVAIIMVTAVVVLAVMASAAPQRLRPVQPPPSMPARFDEVTVQQLIDKAEEGQNAIILKIGYFLRRSNHPLPAQDGYRLLQAALEKEPVGSYRWFVLQTVKGFGGFRIAAANGQDSLNSYHAIFNQAGAAEKAGAINLLHRAALEYASTIYGEYGKPWRTSGLAREVLLKALRAHLQFLPSADPALKISWSRAISSVNGDKEFAAEIDKILNDPTTIKSYLLLRTAADVLEPTAPGRTVELLRQAKPLLPQDDALQRHSLYEQLVQILADMRRWDEALQEQHEYIQVSGGGYARLAQLQWQSGDMKGLDTTLTLLGAPTASEDEINETAALLFNDRFFPDTDRKKELSEKVAALLQSYIMSQRPRDVEQELRARLRLGIYLMSQGNINTAKEVLAVSEIKSTTLSTSAKAYYRRIQKMQSLIIESEGVNP